MAPCLHFQPPDSQPRPTPQANQSLYILGKTITSCTYEPLPDHVPQAMRDLVTAMLQPSPQARLTVSQLVQACSLCAPAACREGVGSLVAHMQHQPPSADD